MYSWKAEVRDFKARYLEAREGTVTLTQYMDGNPALLLEFVDDDGVPEAEVLTVNLRDGRLVVGDYSQHEGVAQALVDAGLCRIVGTIHVGFGTGHVMALNDQISGRRVLTLTLEDLSDGSSLPPLRSVQDPDNGRCDVLDQHLWHGNPTVLVGFTANMRRFEVDVLAAITMGDPSQAVGKYPVCLDSDGQMYTLTLKVKEASTEEAP